MEVYVQELSNKTVIDSNGAVIGELHNVSMNYNTGNLENLLVRPTGSPNEQQRHRKQYNVSEEGHFMIPTTRVQAVKDQVVVE